MQLSILSSMSSELLLHLRALGQPHLVGQIQYRQHPSQIPVQSFAFNAGLGATHPWPALRPLSSGCNTPKTHMTASVRMAPWHQSADHTMGGGASENHAVEHMFAYSAMINHINAWHALHTASNFTIPSLQISPNIPYNLSKWKQALTEHEDQSLITYHLQGLQHGYTHGNHSHTNLHIDSIYPNLTSAFTHQDILTTNICTELMAKCYLGPFSSIDAIPKQFHPFWNSPLGIIPKKYSNPLKFQMIQHLSYPEGESVNDGINPEDYHIEYGSIQVVTSILLSISPSALLWKANITNAFCTIPIHQSDWGMQGIYWHGLFFINMYLPFGLHSAPYIFTSLIDLFIWICTQHHGLNNLSHFVDDFIYVASPSEAWSTFKKFQVLASDFGIPFKSSKFVPPMPNIDYISFQLNAPSMTISIPTDKHARILNLLADWSIISSKHQKPCSCSLSEACSLLSHLMHVMQILPEGKIFCNSLICFTSVWKSPFTGCHHLSARLLTDLG